jgi:hypothetical protein
VHFKPFNGYISYYVKKNIKFHAMLLMRLYNLISFLGIFGIKVLNFFCIFMQSSKVYMNFTDLELHAPGCPFFKVLNFFRRQPSKLCMHSCILINGAQLKINSRLVKFMYTFIDRIKIQKNIAVHVHFKPSN